MTGIALAPRSDFVGLDSVTHLYSGAEGPLLKSAAAALQGYTVEKANGTPGRLSHAEVATRCKDSLGKLLRVSPDDVAFLPTASDAISAVAGTIDFRDDDNVIVNDLEFPSVFLPWMKLREQGVEVRVVQHRGWEIMTKDLLDAVDSRTRLMGLSHVSFFSGLRHDVVALSEELRRRNVRFLLDATQSLGVLPVDANLADYLVCSGYKWLLGLHGSAILYVNRETVGDVQPPNIGWYSVVTPYGPDRFEGFTLKPNASRFETGYPNFPGIYVLNKSIPYLISKDVAAIGAHVQRLGGLLIEGLRSRGLEVITPDKPARRGASVTFFHARAAELSEALGQRGILVWGREGRVRASVHLFNSERDILDLLAALDDLLT